jgi:hypothetical protein
MLEKAKKRKYFQGSSAAMGRDEVKRNAVKPVKIHRIGALSEFSASQSPGYFYRQ